jgi:hypothetical protein
MKDQELTRKGRGEFDYRCDGKVFVVKWYDSSVVHVASNYATHEPLQSTKRRVKRATVNVQQPFLIKSYNQGMGGVDVLDKLLGSYRPTIQGKKWWWPLFIHALNLSVVAAWRLYLHLHPSQKNLSHLDFRRHIALCLLKKTPRRSIMRGQHSHFPIEIRYDGIAHDVVSTSQGRCVLCSTNTRSMCDKCGVRLHYSRGAVCFNVYHTPP